MFGNRNSSENYWMHLGKGVVIRIWRRFIREEEQSSKKASIGNCIDLQEFDQRRRLDGISLDKGDFWQSRVLKFGKF